MVAEHRGAEVKAIPITDRGEIDLPAYHQLLRDGGVKVVAVNHVSNALGTINPVKEMIAAAHEVGAVVSLDGAQGIPHLRVDVQDLDCDFYAFSGHKMCGPTGIGVLWGRKAILEAMSPFQGGGEMIHIVERDQSSWARVPNKFEAGTPNIVGAVGMGAAVDYLNDIGIENIEAHEREIMTYALQQLGQVPGITIYGPKSVDEHSAVISFTMGDAHPHDISTILDMEGVALRAGHHCAQLVMKHFDVSATARASFYLYSTKEDVDRLVEGLDQVAAIFN